MRRLMTLAVVLVLMVFAALPAFAQENGNGESDVAINATVTVAFLAIVIQYLVEWVRSRFTLDGDIIRLVALILGYGAAWLWELDVAADFGFEGLPVLLSYGVAAFVIAGVAGIFSSAKNALRHQDPESSIHDR